MRRLAYLDWLRGLAVLIMILWHTMDSWTSPAARHNAMFAFITLAGGWAAPLFLFLAGVSVALAGESSLINALGAPPPSARAPALEDSLSSRWAQGCEQPTQ